MSQPTPGKGENVLSLQHISRTFFTALQRQHDMLAFSIAGLHTADPKAYEHFSTLSRVMPVPQAHLPPEQMLAYARGLMLRTTINDLLTLSSECMSQCYLLCLFIREQGKNPRRDPLVEKIISEKHQAFVKMNLQSRFTALEEDFGIVCELEDGIFSLAAALRVLARGGLVTNDDITPDGSLTLEFKAMKDVDVLPETTADEPDEAWTGKHGPDLGGHVQDSRMRGAAAVVERGDEVAIEGEVVDRGEERQQDEAGDDGVRRGLV